MGSGSYLGGSTIWGYGARRIVGKATRFSRAMMVAYGLRAMTEAERGAYLRRRRKLKKKPSTKEDPTVVATKREVQRIPTLKPGARVKASALKSSVLTAKALGLLKPGKKSG